LALLQRKWDMPKLQLHWSNACEFLALLQRKWDMPKLQSHWRLKA